MSGGYPKGVWRLCDWWLQALLSVSRCTKRMSENLQNSLGPKMFLGLKVSGGYLWDYQLVCWLARCIRRASLDGTSQDWSNNNWSSQVRTGQVRTGQVRTGRVRTGQIKSRQVSLLSNLTWDCTKVKMKTYTWNSSVALLSPTCISFKLSIWC